MNLDVLKAENGDDLVHYILTGHINFNRAYGLSLASMFTQHTLH